MRESMGTGSRATWKKSFNDAIAPATANAEECVQKRPE